MGFVGVGAVAEFAGLGEVGDFGEVEADFFWGDVPEAELADAWGVDDVDVVVESVEA